jgi:hypothetical protein
VTQAEAGKLLVPGPLSRLLPPGPGGGAAGGAAGPGAGFKFKSLFSDTAHWQPGRPLPGRGLHAAAAGRARPGSAAAYYRACQKDHHWRHDI